MNALLQIGLSNAVVCGIMTVLLLPLARWLRRPALTHALSVLILLKLLTPPLFNVRGLRDSAADLGPLRQITVARATPSRGESTSSPVPSDVTDDDAQAPADDAALGPSLRVKRVASIPSPSPAPPGAWLTLWKAASDSWRS